GRLVSCLLHVSISRVPPTSAPFPYTTLFRSSALSRYRDQEDRGVIAGHHPSRPRCISQPSARVGPVTGFGELLQRVGCRLAQLPDRKSTRLNSSHVSISYAVFCLKNKSQYAR